MLFTQVLGIIKNLIEHWKSYITGKVTMAITIENIPNELQKGVKQPNDKINKDT